MYYNHFIYYNPLYTPLTTPSPVMEWMPLDPRYGMMAPQVMPTTQAAPPEGLGLATGAPRAREAAPEEGKHQSVEEAKQAEKEGREQSVKAEKRVWKKSTTGKRSHHSGADSSGKNPGRWKREEHDKFVKGE